MAHAHEHHIIPKKTLYKVFGALVVLTALTVLTATRVDIGSFNIVLALFIAGSKAALVVTFFMALKYDNRVNTLVFTLGTIFVAVFLTFTLFDTAFRGDLGNVDYRTVADRELELEQLRAEEERLDPADLRVAPADFGTQEAGDTLTVDAEATGDPTSPEAAAPADTTGGTAAESPPTSDTTAADTSAAGGRP